MAEQKAEPTGREVRFDDDDIIVSKTDLQGRITYANDVFLRVAGYRMSEVFGQPHSLIRHRDMPRAVFKALWDTIAAGREIFAYVVNQAKNGDHYWVFAHVTPSFDARGRITEYHSNRRTAPRSAIAAVTPLYAQLRAIERSATDRAEGLAKSSAALAAELKRAGATYDEFVWSLENAAAGTSYAAGEPRWLRQDLRRQRRGQPGRAADAGPRHDRRQRAPRQLLETRQGAAGLGQTVRDGDVPRLAPRHRRAPVPADELRVHAPHHEADGEE